MGVMLIPCIVGDGVLASVIIMEQVHAVEDSGVIIISGTIVIVLAIFLGLISRLCMLQLDFRLGASGAGHGM